jgi:hypothetical protein
VRLLGIVLILLVLVGVAWIAVLFATQSGNPSVPVVGLIAVVGALAGVLGFAAFSIALASYNEATDWAVAFVRHTSPDFSAFEAHEMLRSLSAFDSGLSGRIGVTTSASATPENMAWTPDLARPILPGLPESTLVAIHRRIGAVAAAGLVILAVLAILHRAPAPRTWYSSWALVGAVFLVSFAFWLVAIGRGRREFREGYTTSPAGTQLIGRVGTRPVDAHTSLDFVDGKTGYLLRHADTVLLTPAVYSQRLGEIRAGHPQATPSRIPSPAAGSQPRGL